MGILNLPNNRVDRTPFGEMTLYSSGVANIKLAYGSYIDIYGSYIDIGEEKEDVTLGQLVVGYKRYKKLRELLKD